MGNENPVFLSKKLQDFVNASIRLIQLKEKTELPMPKKVNLKK